MHADYAQTEFGHDWAGVDLAETGARPLGAVVSRALLLGSLGCLSVAGMVGLMASLG